MLQYKLSYLRLPLFAEKAVMILFYFMFRYGGEKKGRNQNGKITYDNIDTITPAEIAETVKTPKTASASGDIIGKMIEDYKWKLAATFTEGQAAVLTENTYVQIIVGADQSEINAKVENIEKHGDDYVAVFSADDLNSTIASSRVGRFKLLVDSYNGIRIASSAIHFDNDNNIGVYIKSGTQAQFVKIERIYSSEDYVIVRDTTDKSGYLSLYDNVIVEGKDLHWGLAKKQSKVYN